MTAETSTLQLACPCVTQLWGVTYAVPRGFLQGHPDTFAVLYGFDILLMLELLPFLVCIPHAPRAFPGNTS